MAHDVFISYSNKDKTTADAICSRMESEGIRCWYAPRDIVPGASWANSIIEAINSTKIMVLVFTDYSNVSSQVLREVSNAVSAGVTIIPFRLTESEPAGDMQYYLSVVHWLDAMNGELDNSIGSLTSLCRTIIDSGEADPDAVKKAAAKAEEERLKKQKEREEAERLAARKKKQLIIICACAAVALAVILGIVFLGGSGGKAGQTADTAPGQTADTQQGPVKATSDAVVDDPSESYTRGNSQSCLQWGGYIATDGDWYYYSSNEGGALWKMKADGSEKQKLSEDSARQIHVIDGYIYYQCSVEGSSGPSIKRVRTDGTDEKVLHNGMIENMKIIGDRIYFKDQLDSLHLHSISLDGTDEKADNPTEEMYDCCSDGKYLYYAYGQDGNKVYRSGLDGSDPVLMIDHEVNGMTIAGNRLYYNDSTNHYLCSYDLSTGESKELAMEYIGYINVTPDGIYGYNGSQETYLCSLQLDGLGMKILAEDDADEICVCGDRIYYHCGRDKCYYICDLDGSNKMTP